MGILTEVKCENCRLFVPVSPEEQARMRLYILAQAELFRIGIASSQDEESRAIYLMLYGAFIDNLESIVGRRTCEPKKLQLIKGCVHPIALGSNGCVHLYKFDDKRVDSEVD